MRHSGWRWALVFGVLVYVAGAAAQSLLGGHYSAQTKLWLSPVVPTLFGVAAFIQWQRWKVRARARERDLKIWKEALYSVCYEATNAANAIRSNLIAFREANRGVEMAVHLEEIGAGTARIAKVVRIADDPVGWHLETKGRKAAAGAAELTEAARPRVAL